MNASGDAAKGLVKSLVEFSLAASLLADSLGGFAREVWRLRHRLPAHESGQLRRLVKILTPFFHQTLQLLIIFNRKYAKSCLEDTCSFFYF